MPVTRADELNARPADTANELLALAERLTSMPRGWLPSCNRDGEAVVNITYTLAEAAMVEAALRLCARQQASVEEIISACVPGGQSCDPQQIADALRCRLAKYDIFEEG